MDKQIDSIRFDWKQCGMWTFEREDGEWRTEKPEKEHLDGSDEDEYRFLFVFFVASASIAIQIADKFSTVGSLVSLMHILIINP